MQKCLFHTPIAIRLPFRVQKCLFHTPVAILQPLRVQKRLFCTPTAIPQSFRVQKRLFYTPVAILQSFRVQKRLFHTPIAVHLLLRSTMPLLHYIGWSKPAGSISHCQHIAEHNGGHCRYHRAYSADNGRVMPAYYFQRGIFASEHIYCFLLPCN